VSGSPAYLLLFFFLLFDLTGSYAEERSIILATTTSTQDSGLLEMLIPIFERKTGFFVKTIAVGSGQAMALGRRGEADVLLVHSPVDARKFMEEGFGSRRRPVMYNRFLVLGPPEDPAKIRGLLEAKEALRRIASSSALFISRGDGSGTHTKERALWRKACFEPEGRIFYQETGLGMGQTLAIASEKRGYTICDEATYLSLRKAIVLDVLCCKRDPLLLNVYHVIEVNPSKWPKVNSRGARLFADFIVSKEGQRLIGTFGVSKFGSPLFFPCAGRGKEFD
jgi:tungstate transport system substrate-binding protein